MEEFCTKVEKITENIYVIDQEMVRAYVIVGGNKALCFDFGVALTDFKKCLKEITGLPFIYVLSHSDRDHVANMLLADKVYLSPNELDLLKDYGGMRFISVEEGHVFDLGGVELEVVYTPGHTPGSISLLWRSKRILFSGDTLSYGPVYMFGPARDLEKYKNTLNKLLDMSQKKIFFEIFPSHNLFPADPSIIKDLLEIVEDLETGKAVGRDPGRTFPGFEDVRLFCSGKCGIFF